MLIQVKNHLERFGSDVGIKMNNDTLANSHQARELGITGVPTFIIGDKMIVGAQSYKELKEATLKFNKNNF